MARFEVFANPGGAGYVLDVQADVLNRLNTRIVVPLVPMAQSPVPAKRLNPVFEIGDEQHVMVTQFLAAVPCALLRNPVTSLVAQDSEIMAALDMVLVGFWPESEFFRWHQIKLMEQGRKSAHMFHKLSSRSVT